MNEKRPIGCDELEKLLPSFDCLEDAELLEAIDSHAASCPGCSRRYSAMKGLGEMFTDFTADPSSATALQDRIMSALPTADADRGADRKIFSALIAMVAAGFMLVGLAAVDPGLNGVYQTANQLLESLFGEIGEQPYSLLDGFVSEFAASASAYAVQIVTALTLSFAAMAYIFYLASQEGRQATTGAR